MVITFVQVLLQWSFSSSRPCSSAVGRISVFSLFLFVPLLMRSTEGSALCIIFTEKSKGLRGKRHGTWNTANFREKESGFRKFQQCAVFFFFSSCVNPLQHNESVAGRWGCLPPKMSLLPQPSCPFKLLRLYRDRAFLWCYTSASGCHFQKH